MFHFDLSVKADLQRLNTKAKANFCRPQGKVMFLYLSVSHSSMWGAYYCPLSTREGCVNGVRDRSKTANTDAWCENGLNVIWNKVKYQFVY